MQALAVQEIDLRGHVFAGDRPGNWCRVLAHPRRLPEPYAPKGAATIFHVDVPRDRLGPGLSAEVER